MKWDTDGGNGWWWWWWLRVVRMSNDSANENRGSNGLSPHPIQGGKDKEDARHGL
jgi:hypothetical protein